MKSSLNTMRTWVALIRQRKGLAVLGAVALAALLMSCASVERTVVAPPGIPGAKFVGSDTCVQCHEKASKNFHTSDHARLVAKGANASEMGCEACHGPGSLHNESGGARGTIINPKKDSQTCFQCHLDKRGSFSLASHHPIENGKVSCSDCHNPHEGKAVKGGGTSMASSDETCYKCHSRQHGPFVFEHEALREGCQSCHDPHGSVNQKMLVARSSNLCLRCHFQDQLVPGKVFIGGRDHSDDLGRGTCWSAGCHEAVHGSQINRSLRF